jgi:hypothetical protein
MGAKHCSALTIELLQKSKMLIQIQGKGVHVKGKNGASPLPLSAAEREKALEFIFPFCHLSTLILLWYF